MKKLGLDIGTNSIGWALVETDFDKKEGKILDAGCRIIPMGQDVLGKFDAGVSISQTAARTKQRGMRRLYQRQALRRERLHRVLHILDYLPTHYADEIDFNERLGQFKDGREVKLNYAPGVDGRNLFLFEPAYTEMVELFKMTGYTGNIPKDWTLYYLRKKALGHAITKEELAWVLLSFNQKRGYHQLRDEIEDDADDKKEENKEYHRLKVTDVRATGEGSTKGKWYDVILENGWVYRYPTTDPLEKWRDGWIGMEKEFIVTTKLDDSGQPKIDKDGNVQRSFKKVDSEKDWPAIKAKTEQDLDGSGKQLGEYIFDALLDNPQQKIIGKLIRVVQRSYYKNELCAILEQQKGHHEEFRNKDLLKECSKKLYRHNEAHRNALDQKDLVHLLVEDILFYQRPLKSKKSDIADCQYEFRNYKKDGEEQKSWLKGAPRSHPLFQEFRLWQFIHNLRLYAKQVNTDGRVAVDVDLTKELLGDVETRCDLFNHLLSKKEVDQKSVIKYLIKAGRIPKDELENYRWNYVEDKSYPAGETRSLILSRWKKVEGLVKDRLPTEAEELKLWHMIHSIQEPDQFRKGLGTYATKHDLPKAAFVEAFQKVPRATSDYASYSLRALNKLLPLMRQGSHWSADGITPEVQKRYDDIMARLGTIGHDREKLDEIADDDIPRAILKSFVEHNATDKLSGLNTYQACYLVYGRHTEAVDNTPWRHPDEIDAYLNKFKQHSLRNPIVEQVVLETLRLVRDIWKTHGTKDGEVDPAFFDRIHLELGRSMKNPKDKRKRMTEQNTENENTNERIRKLLTELGNDGQVAGDVRAFSPSQQEILKIYEDGVYNNPEVDYSSMSQADIEKIRKNQSPSVAKSPPTRSDLTKYKLWLAQGYISPYTSQVIPLSRLFTTDYEIEHIIPRSRYFDDSLTNKVICEAEVNAAKDNSLGYEFMKARGTEIIPLGNGRSVQLLSLEAYMDHCRRYFKSDRTKLQKLLAEEVPTGFIERQLNDSRYISKLVMGLLSNIVREDGELDTRSKNLVTVVGSITSRLKQDWGLNDKWNELIAPRFKRMNELTGTNDFGHWDERINAFRPMVPDQLLRGFSKKRIDHRHHALDAIVIACATADHINYITSLNTERNNYALVNKLRRVEEVRDQRTGHTRKAAKEFIQPWTGFTTAAKGTLERMVVSFKQNKRVINRTTNLYWSYTNEEGQLRRDEHGQPKKALTKQTKGDSWSIRKSLHKESVFGKATLNRIAEKTVPLAKAIEMVDNLVDKRYRKLIAKQITELGGNHKKILEHFKKNPLKENDEIVNKFQVYVQTEVSARRMQLTDSFTEKQLDSVTDSGIREILKRHAAKYKHHKPDEVYPKAFSPEGLKEMNDHIQELNGGKRHAPIFSVRKSENGNHFQLGTRGNNKTKYVEADKGTNLYFAVYWDKGKDKRTFETIPLEDVIKHQKQVANLPRHQRTEIELNPNKGKFLFSLSPNDLVYLPTEEEIEQGGTFESTSPAQMHVDRIYKMVSANKEQCFFISANVASTIVSGLSVRQEKDSGLKNEFAQASKEERAISGVMIKNHCLKLRIDRVGRIIKVEG